MDRGTAGTLSKVHIAGVVWLVVVVVKNSSSRIALCRCAHPGGQNNQRSLGWGDPCSAAATSLPGVSN